MSRSLQVLAEPHAAPAVSIVIPTYNELESLPRLVPEVHGTLRATPHEIVVVDADSPDQTGRWVEEAARTDRKLRLVRCRRERGLSGAVVEGFRAARADRWVVMDGDGQHDPALLPEMCRALETRELVVASRYAAPGETGPWSPGRRLGSRGAIWFARLLLRTPLSDPMSGYFGIRRPAFDRVAADLHPRGFKILLELHHRLSRLRPEDRAWWVELPVRFRRRFGGKSKLTGGMVWQYLQMLLALRRDARHRP